MLSLASFKLDLNTEQVQANPMHVNEKYVVYPLLRPVMEISSPMDDLPLCPVSLY
jgi:hypothetical protein